MVKSLSILNILNNKHFYHKYGTTTLEGKKPLLPTSLNVLNVQLKSRTPPVDSSFTSSLCFFGSNIFVSIFN